MSEVPQSIYEKLRAVQLELKVPKNQRNSFGGYNYRNAEDILEAVKPVCDKNGLTLIVSDELVNIGERYYVEATAAVSDGGDASGVTVLSASGYAREEETKKGMDGAQITGAASSYARKYALNGLFAIDDTKDADSDEHTAQRRDSAPTAAHAPVKPLVAPEAPRRLVTSAQAAMLLGRAKQASGLTDKVEIMDWFIATFGMAVNEVQYDEVESILRRMPPSKEQTS